MTKNKSAIATTKKNETALSPLYEIVGELYRGDETPAFRALLFLSREPIAKITSDGGGGCARIEWLGIAADTRTAAVRWLGQEALRLWPREYGAPPSSLLAVAEEAALLVVPDMIGAPMTARYTTSEMKPGVTCDLRLLVESNRESPDLCAKFRKMEIGETLYDMITVTRIS